MRTSPEHCGSFSVEGVTFAVSWASWLVDQAWIRRALGEKTFSRAYIPHCWSVQSKSPYPGHLRAGSSRCGECCFSHNRIRSFYTCHLAFRLEIPSVTASVCPVVFFWIELDLRSWTSVGCLQHVVVWESSVSHNREHVYDLRKTRTMMVMFWEQLQFLITQISFLLLVYFHMCGSRRSAGRNAALNCLSSAIAPPMHVGFICIFAFEIPCWYLRSDWAIKMESEHPWEEFKTNTHAH